MMGWNKIPDVWKSGIPALADRKFSYTDFTFQTIVDSTVKRAVAVVQKAGGRVEGDRLIVPAQTAQAAKLEAWDGYGSPVESIGAREARWKFGGAWTTNEKTGQRVSEEKGATAEIEFEGTGFIVVGPYLKDGGWAEAWVDGKKVNNVDVYPDEDANKGEESVFHQFELKRGKHTVKLVVTGVRHTNSSGAKIAVDRLVVFR
jgi:hypothetical protein